jgi:hypothetical protein
MLSGQCRYRFGAALQTGLQRCAQVAGKMGSEATHFLEAPESEHEIRRSCRQVKQLYNDPTVVHRLALQVAIAEERYDDACMCASSHAPIIMCFLVWL